MKNFSKFLIFILFFSCNKKEQTVEIKNNIYSEDVNYEWKGKKIFYPKSVHPIIDKKEMKHQFSIVVYYDGGCSVCYIQLLDWIKCIKDIEGINNDIQFKFILSGYTKKLLEINLRKINFPLEKVFFDSKNDFISKYSFFLDKGYENSTILLDKSDKILLIGNPMISENMMKKYIELIKN